MNIVARSKRTSLCFALGLLALTVVFMVLSYDYAPKVRLFPLLVGYASLVLCLLDLIGHTDTALGLAVKTVFSGTTAGEGAPAPQGAPAVRRQAAAMAWMAGLTTGIYLVGFLGIVPVYVFLSMYFQGRKSIKACAYGAVATTAFVWLVFELLLRYELYRGVIAQ